jgi:hypothetical protein
VAAFKKVKGGIDFAGMVSDALSGSPYGLLVWGIERIESIFTIDPDIQDIYAQALAQAWQDCFPEPKYHVLNAKIFSGYLSALPQTTNFVQLNQSLVRQLIKNGDLSDEAEVKTKTQEFCQQALEAFVMLLQQEDKAAVLPKLLLESVNELRNDVGDTIEGILDDIQRLQAQLKAKSLIAFSVPKLPENPKPSTLLKSTYEVVPFAGREDELADLTAWSEAKARFAVRLYVGAGGVGKTRLMRELCKQKQREGWQVGFLVGRIPDDADYTLLPDPTRPTLMVVDYAETRTDVLGELINTVERQVNSERGQPFRVVLLARTAGDWWDNAKLNVDSQLPDPFDVIPLAKTYRKDTFKQAASAFAERLAQEAVTDIPLHIKLNDDPFGRVLLIHMQALLVVTQADTTGQQDSEGIDILDNVLALEQRYWTSVHELLGGKEQAEKVMMRLLSLATLGYALTDEHVADLREKKESFARLQELDSEVFIEQLSNLYVETSALLPPLEPDLLGEHLIEKTLLRSGKVSPVGKELIALTFHSAEPPASYQQGLDVLVRLAARRGEVWSELIDKITTPVQKEIVLNLIKEKKLKKIRI